ncbi:aminotransferase class I/II-fold pyridoxal phosphate-dependent enzyme [Patiriisocius sp. Uisw_017]|uniref:aminotransferase class I/II-fold pyridoxal phosphate-dependent enzyme n=1 Tax=Patiriisocius sp. Uisw_017 TaxID=3230968 RepID=UPI0039EA5AE9
MLPVKLRNKIEGRKAENALRILGGQKNLIDFSSNDYLGFSSSKIIFKKTLEILKHHKLEVNGATGSRLLSGNHALYNEAEDVITKFHNTEAALIFNSGYDANIGLFSSVPQRGDLILYDELCHASIRDGIRMSNAKAFKFKHNDLNDLTKNIENLRSTLSRVEVYIVTESVFSMDGDQSDLRAVIAICKKYNCNLIVDEAHAVGVFGSTGEGLVQELGIENEIFARIVTFGKALGCHGAAILGTNDLKEYLINFARSFIYTTGLPPHTVATILSVYQELQNNSIVQNKLKSNIAVLQLMLKENSLVSQFIRSNSAIQSCLISGNDKVKEASMVLEKYSLDVKPILSPTVTEGKERLRICLHSYNTKEEITQLVMCLVEYIKKK